MGIILFSEYESVGILQITNLYFIEMSLLRVAPLNSRNACANDTYVQYIHLCAIKIMCKWDYWMTMTILHWITLVLIENSISSNIKRKLFRWYFSHTIRYWFRISVRKTIYLQYFTKDLLFCKMLGFYGNPWFPMETM